MGKATVYCETCGEGIPEDDFDKGRAVRYQEKDYCAKCKQEISHLLKPAEDADALARKTSRIRTVDPNSASGVRKSSGVRSQSGVRRTVQGPAVTATPARGTPHVTSGNGHREHPSQLRGPAAPPRQTASGEKKMYLIAGAAVLLVVIILAVASMSKKSAENTDSEKRQVRDKIAKEAYENCKAYRDGAPHEFVGLLSLLAEAKAAVAGTDWDVPLAQLQKEAEGTKRAKEKRDETATKVNDLRSRIGQEPKAANEIKLKLEAIRGEVPDDKDLQEQISIAIEEARRALFQCEFDDANQYVQTNPKDYTGEIDKYNKLRQDLEAFTTDYQQQMLPQIDERIRWVKEARETDATSQWTTIHGNAEAYRQKREYFTAKSEVKNFIDNDQYSMCSVMNEARNFLREIEQEEQAWNEQQRREREKPPDPGPGPGPGPAAGAITLFDGVNRPGMTRGGTATWEVANGELRVKHNDPNLPAAGPQVSVTDILEFHMHQCESCVFELDAKIVKGGLGVFLGFRMQGSEVKVTSGNSISNPAIFTPDSWHHLRLDYDGSKVTLTIDGGNVENLEIQDRGRGSCALAVFPGCEVHMKNITLLQK